MSPTGYNLTQDARLAQKMSPQQIMAASLLQSTAQELRAEIRLRQERNPAIEDVRWGDEPVLSDVVGESAGGRSAVDNAPLDFTPDGPAAERILASAAGREEFLGNMQSASTDSSDDSRLQFIRDNGSKWDADREERRQFLFDSAVAGESLEEHLRRQIEISDFTPAERAVAEVIIGNLDDDGYFVGSLPDICMTTRKSEEEILSVQRRICNTFDPPGIAARNLKECLLAQMDRFDDSPWEDEIRKAVECHLDDLGAGDFEKVRTALGLTAEEWGKFITEFAMFSRKPALQRYGDVGGSAGRSMDPNGIQYVYPEIHAVKRDGKWIAVVTDGAIPRIVISTTYRRMADDETLPKDARAAVRDYVRDAELLEDLLDDRQEKLHRVAQAIIDAQPDFFEKGLDGLRPLSRSTIAQRVNLDDSVVSRAVKGKYMTTPFGTMELGRFFVSGMATSEGMVTPQRIKARIREIISSEETPLSDEAISAKLNEEGFKISRRTVAKYREAEGIPGSSHRRACRI